MNATIGDLRSLSRGASSATGVPRPASRWKTRILVPLAVVLCAAALVAYAARGAFTPAVEVWVVPVVARPASAGSASPPAPGPGPAQVLVQAPGWIEADPYAISVPALAEGVVREVLVLEGQHVSAGDVVARMIDDDARLAVQRADAELASMRAEVDRAKADAAAAAARAAEARDEVNRKRDLVDSGGFSAGQFARLELRLNSLEREVDSANAAIALAQANVARHDVVCAEARLALDRMQVRAAASGIVLARLVEPGTRISMASRSGDAMAGAVLRLYDPAHLQVRADVPLADAAKIGIGSPATITTEALPDITFTGKVSRIVQEANIQRNTVQFKVAIDEPALGGGALKPEMLTRVRFHGGAASTTAHNTGTPPSASGGDLRIILPAALVGDSASGKAEVWVVGQSGREGGPVAARRAIALGSALANGLVDITDGLRPGDRVIVDPPASLKPGTHLYILGERAETADLKNGAAP